MTLVKPFTNAMLIWTTTAENPRLEGWIDMRADEHLVHRLHEVTEDFDALLHRPPAFLTRMSDKVSATEVPTMIKGFLATYNKPAGMPMIVEDIDDAILAGHQAMVDAQAAKQQERKDRKKAKQKATPEPEEEEEEEFETTKKKVPRVSEAARMRAKIAELERQIAAGAGPGPSAVQAQAQEDEAESESEADHAAGAGDDVAPPRATESPAPGEVTRDVAAHGTETMLHAFVTTDLAHVIRRPILEADFKVIRNDREQLQACNICQESVIVPVPHYMHELRAKPDLSEKFHTFSRCNVIGSMWAEDEVPETHRATIENSGMFIIAKPGKTIAVLDDMFLSTNEYGKYLRRAKLIFANPPWGIWRGKADQPLTEREIRDFAQCFKRIVDPRGAVIVEPGPSPSHNDAWFRAMEEAGFALCRSPWYAECIWKRPRPFYHTSPPTMACPLLVFYVKNSEKTPTAPGVSCNKGVASMAYGYDFHRRALLKYHRLADEKVTGPGSRNQSNSLILLAKLIQL